jgi:hypothetical protein
MRRSQERGFAGIRLVQADLKTLIGAAEARLCLRKALKTRIGEQTEHRRSLPRVDHMRTSCFKICDVARDDRHPMNKDSDVH